MPKPPRRIHFQVQTPGFEPRTCLSADGVHAHAEALMTAGAESVQIVEVVPMTARGQMRRLVQVFTRYSDY